MVSILDSTKVDLCQKNCITAYIMADVGIIALHLSANTRGLESTVGSWINELKKSF
jgi:hypothetical protein